MCSTIAVNQRPAEPSPDELVGMATVSGRARTSHNAQDPRQALPTYRVSFDPMSKYLPSSHGPQNLPHSPAFRQIMYMSVQYVVVRQVQYHILRRYGIQVLCFLVMPCGWPTTGDQNLVPKHLIGRENSFLLSL